MVEIENDVSLHIVFRENIWHGENLNGYSD